MSCHLHISFSLCEHPRGLGMWGGQRWRGTADLPPCWGPGRGREMCRVGRCGGSGESACLHSLGTPSGLWGVYPHSVPVAGTDSSFPPAGAGGAQLPPHWQLWSCPCHQGQSHRCAQWGWTHRTPGGDGPSTQLPSPTPVPKQVAASREHPVDPCSAPSMATPSLSPRDPVVSIGVLLHSG